MVPVTVMIATALRPLLRRENFRIQENGVDQKICILRNHPMRRSASSS
jgi:hypothetical protein